MARLRGRRLRWVIAGVLVVVLAVAVAVTWPLVRRYTGAAPQDQFSQSVRLDPGLARDYRRVLGVAHNAGNNLGSLATALRAGADVIEIDVISARGRLVAGRPQPLPWLARQLFRGPTLAQAWDRARAARVIKLDLKQGDRSFLADVADFLARRAASRRVMVASPDPAALSFLHRRLPGLTLLFSVNGPDPVSQLESDHALQQVIDGASVYEGLVDAALADWMHEHKLQIVAWTVNNGERFNELVRLGVDGITTDNLAILRALSQRHDRSAVPG
ncbi:MAG: glycerophosphodiester phosphodiesterase [Nocardiopsaceae bacterium]|jgi:glycerophosphoryl diester phosphodiesterase|nr:glycerophosphodiester phosphodiesterase [Nocardiopsaceae bacterium]